MFGDEERRERRKEERKRERGDRVLAAHWGRLLRYMSFTQIHKANIKAAAAGDSSMQRGQNMSGQKAKCKKINAII